LRSRCTASRSHAAAAPMRAAAPEGREAPASWLASGRAGQRRRRLLREGRDKGTRARRRRSGGWRGSARAGAGAGARATRRGLLSPPHSRRGRCCWPPARAAGCATVKRAALPPLSDRAAPGAKEVAPRVGDSSRRLPAQPDAVDAPAPPARVFACTPPRSAPTRC
jgi:hypothetical protein